MARKFIFNDDDELEISDVDKVNEIPVSEEPVVEDTSIEEPIIDEPTIVVHKDAIYEEVQEDDKINTQSDNTELSEEIPDESSEKESCMKKVLHMKWKWWHYILLGIIVLGLLFTWYIYSVSNNDGPVYGNRCDGVVEIPVDAKSAVIENMRKEYDEINTLEIEIACKQIKFDISFKEGTKTKTCINITEKVIQAFDKEVGLEKPEGKTYSNLFGSIENEPQYEINVYLQCTNNDEFPVYGTKHTQRDKITYTYNKIADQDSYDKAVSTLEEDEEE